MLCGLSRGLMFIVESKYISMRARKVNTCAAVSSWHVGRHEKNLHTFNLIVIAKPSHFTKFGDYSSLETLDLIPRNMKY